MLVKIIITLIVVIIIVGCMVAILGSGGVA